MDNTTNLAEFGSRELYEASRLLHALSCSPRTIGSYDNLRIEFNPNSGNVFFYVDENQVFMMNGNDLEEFVTCFDCGLEGFVSEVNLKDGLCEDCQLK